VISIEPIPSTFKKLRRNVELNELTEEVELKCYGVGAARSTLRFTEAMDTVNHVVGEDEPVDDMTVIEVPVVPLSELLEGREPVIFKMDVEGFEWPALNGSTDLLSSSSLKGLIIELNGSGGRYGYSDDKIHDLLLSKGFIPHVYEPFSRQLTPVSTYGKDNTIYVKDIDWVSARLKEARKYRILGIEV
jgi:FkbM family methyltransferase